MVVTILRTAYEMRVRADAVISLTEREVLIGDKLAGALEIVVEDFAKGLWRLRGEDVLHESDMPQLW